MAKKKDRRPARSTRATSRHLLDGLEEADRLLRRRKRIEARHLLEELDHRHPGREEVLSRLLPLLLELGDLRAYEATCQRLLKLRPDDPNLALALAGACLHNAHPALALQTFRWFLQHWPDQPRAADARKAVAALEVEMEARQTDLGFSGIRAPPQAPGLQPGGFPRFCEPLKGHGTTCMATVKALTPFTVPATGLEPGDRFELALPSADGRLRLPDFLATDGVAVEAVEDASGRVLGVRRESADRALVLDEPDRLGASPRDTLWLEYRDRGRFRLLVEPEPPGALPAEWQTDKGVPISLDPADTGLVHDAWRQQASLPEFDLALQAARLSTHAGFDRLICLPLVREMELLEHQIRTAKTVLQRFRGRALLCDEVGLGKTIEAGLVFAELRMRGLIRSALVLVPPSLIEQWQGEMRRKFSLDLISHDDPAFRAEGTDAWKKHDLIIASMHTAKREPHRSAILARQWDLVIIDEAHHLRNRNTQLWRMASELRKQYILLLTATPVQNNLEELFNLVTLLEPGLLRTARQFQKQFVDRRDKLAPRNLDELHRLLSEVMVRNRRSTVGLQFTRRWARTTHVSPSPGEKELYEAVAEFVRRHLRADGGKAVLTRMALVALQMALGSSSQAAAGTLHRLAETPSLSAADRETLTRLAEQAAGQAESSKVDQLLKILDEYPDKMVIFTQFRATQEMLWRRLEQAGHSVAVFHGGLSRLAKEEAIKQFRGPARLLLATEAGSEGRNLQFAHAVCNFDLPWNPMRIEQRIGRLSRIGQTQDIYVYNLVAAGTVEAAVLHLLEAKLNLFELVIGEIDMILGNLDEEREFQDVVADLWAESADLGEFKQHMEALGDRLLAAKEEYLRQRSHDDRLFGDRFAPDR